MVSEDKGIQVRLNSIRFEAVDINSYEFVALGDACLPEFTAGSHIELALGNGMARCYSLCNAPSDRDRYVIAVSKNPAGKGGSTYFHEHARVGATYHISRPRNNFPLASDEKKSVLIGGGIGVTPIWSMARYLQEAGRPWKLYYRARDREHAAMLGDSFCSTSNWIEVVFDADLEKRGLGLADYIPEVVAKEGPDCHYYCCGPSGMLESFKDATRHLASEQVHLEHFSASIEKAALGGYEVVLAKRNLRIKVDNGQTVLDALLGQGIVVTHSCKEGVCGACEVLVLDGTPDHRDSILSDAEKKTNRSMFVCCSGSLTPSLTLDL